MNILTSASILLSLALLATGCKKYKSSPLSFGTGEEIEQGEEDPSLGSEGDTEEPEGDEGEGDDSADLEGTTSSPAESIESLTVWTGNSTFGKASGEGYKVDGKTMMLTNTSKAIFGSISNVGKVQVISEDQITEVMDIVKAAKPGTPSPAPAPCDKDKMLTQNYISIVKAGVEENILNAAVATCEGKRYIDSASFQKITTWLKTNFPPITTTTPGGTPPTP